jgi:hypothetical protein
MSPQWGETRGFFARRGREGFAENAKEGKERETKIQENKIFNLIPNFEISFLYSFCIFFSPFAKPSRPLRSKKISTSHH